MTGQVSWTFHDLGSRTPAHAVPGQSGRPVDGGAPLPEQTPAELRLAVTMPDGQQLSRTLALVPMTVSSRAISAPLLCPSGCRLDAFEFRLTDAATSARARSGSPDSRSTAPSPPRRARALAAVLGADRRRRTTCGSGTAPPATPWR